MDQKTKIAIGAGVAFLVLLIVLFAFKKEGFGEDRNVTSVIFTTSEELNENFTPALTVLLIDLMQERFSDRLIFGYDVDPRLGEKDNFKITVLMKGKREFSELFHLPIYERTHQVKPEHVEHVVKIVHRVSTCK